MPYLPPQRLFLVLLVLLGSATCGRNIPKEYGLYVYDGKSPVALDRGAYRSFYVNDSWALNFIDSSALTSDGLSKIRGVDGPRDVRLLAYFRGVQPGNVEMFETEFDLFVENATLLPFNYDHRQYVFDQPGGLIATTRENVRLGMPTVGLDYWLAPHDFLPVQWSQHAAGHWVPTIRGGNASKGVFREANHRGNKVELGVQPVENVADAYFLAPKQELKPGVYLILVKGDDAGAITQGKGGALLRIGQAADIEALVEQGTKVAIANLQKHNMSDALATAPGAKAASSSLAMERTKNLAEATRQAEPAANQPTTEHDLRMADAEADAVGSLNKMWAGALAAYDQGKAFPKGNEEFTPELCSGRTSKDDVARAFSQEPWTSLSITPPANKYLQYQFRSSGKEKNAKFMAVVAFNPNCVGPKKYFSRCGNINKSGDLVGPYHPNQSAESPKW